MIFAAIDIGSNAVRLLIDHVFETKDKPYFDKEELIRMPIRLGEDTFLHGEISKIKIEKLTATMRGFSELMKVYDITAYRACATSAMRDAKNGKEVIERVKKESGISIEIIDGKTEAATIFSNHVEDLLDPDKNYLYIDVGGGSTELTLLSNKKVVAQKSFNVGTLRMLFNKIDKDEWDAYKLWVRKNTIGVKPLHGIGSGGNINKLFKMGGKKENKHLSYDKLKSMHDMLSSYTFEERITVLGLKPDRADVIIPASKIFLSAMKHAEIERIFVPQIGLSDGIIHQLYEEHKRKKK
ncbi:MAG TPA: exopolyphosphatase [Bacteroidia bacterium]|jgi:exopolyphosphatase/guanosine-5'-triphosphate,3'-diphosphate pyrophosphatase|nr:exopolyphosphatase [Bacteroidia bacterium]